MPLIPPVDTADLDTATRERVARAADWMGYRPNDALTMARVPGLLDASAALIEAAYAPGKVDTLLKRMTAYLSSRVAGCRYCEAHTAHGLARNGLGEDKLAAIWQYQTSPLFNPAERAALEFAAATALDPDNVDPAVVTELREHYDDDQIAELVAVLALFAFLNRWNSAVATELEDAPLNYAEAALKHTGFAPGRHAGEED